MIRRVEAKVVATPNRDGTEVTTTKRVPSALNSGPCTGLPGIVTVPPD